MALGWRLYWNYWIIKEKITTEKINFTYKQNFLCIRHRIKYFLLLLRWHTVGNPDISKKNISVSESEESYKNCARYRLYEWRITLTNRSALLLSKNLKIVFLLFSLHYKVLQSLRKAIYLSTSSCFSSQDPSILLGRPWKENNNQVIINFEGIIVKKFNFDTDHLFSVSGDS